MKRKNRRHTRASNKHVLFSTTEKYKRSKKDLEHAYNIVRVEVRRLETDLTNAAIVYSNSMERLNALGYALERLETNKYKYVV